MICWMNQSSCEILRLLRMNCKNFSDKILNACGMAMHQKLRKSAWQKVVDSEPYLPRLVNYKPVTSVVKAMNRLNVDTLLSIRGTIMRMCQVKHRYLWMCFVCKECGGQQLVRQNNGRVVLPKSCKEKGCRNTNKTNFDYIHNSLYAIFEPFQQIQLQQSIHEKDGGNQMQYLDVVSG